MRTSPRGPGLARARRPVALLIAVGSLLVAGLPSAPSGAATASFTLFAAPSSAGANAGEPGVGVNWKTGAVMVQSGDRTFRVTNFNTTRRTATWTNVTPQPTSINTLDPILFTDVRTNRTYVSHLQVDCSFLAFTDDDGKTWTQNPVGCGAGSVSPDHQNVGGGPFAAPLTGATSYKNAVYYCSKFMVTQCSISLDGGLAFGPAVPAGLRPLCQNGGGHIAVGPDGTAYLPHDNCGGKPGVIVSTDNGATWNARTVDTDGLRTQHEGDPGVAVGAKGTVYFGYQHPNGHAYVAVSRDKGTTWKNVKDVGASLGVKNSQFHSMVAGDDSRAAFAFLGTKTSGNDQASTFKGAWHLYVSFTYDGGKTWKTQDLTPTDPVQRGLICMGGIACGGGRNLLDFMGIALDRSGRVYVAFPDGCIGACVTNASAPSNTALATIARQSSGPDLIATR